MTETLNRLARQFRARARRGDDRKRRGGAAVTEATTNQLPICLQGDVCEADDPITGTCREGRSHIVHTATILEKPAGVRRDHEFVAHVHTIECSDRSDRTLSGRRSRMTESLREQMLATVKGPEVGGICRVCAGTGGPTCTCDGQYCRCTPGYGKYAEHCYHCDGVGIQRQFVKAVDAIEALIEGLATDLTAATAVLNRADSLMSMLWHRHRSKIPYAEIDEFKTILSLIQGVTR